MDHDGSAPSDGISTDNISQTLEKGDNCEIMNESKTDNPSFAKEDNSFETRVDVHATDSSEMINNLQGVCLTNEKDCFSFHIENEITKQMKLANLDRTCKRTTVDSGPNFEKEHSEQIELLKDDNEVDFENLDSKEEHEKEMPVSRRRSLPEVVATPNTTAYRVSAKISKQTQCSLLHQAKGSLEEQFIKTVKTNTKLSEELSHARKEIEILRQRLKQIEVLCRLCLRGLDTLGRFFTIFFPTTS